jgi:hypothetical protein
VEHKIAVNSDGSCVCYGEGPICMIAVEADSPIVARELWKYHYSEQYRKAERQTAIAELADTARLSPEERELLSGDLG